MINRNVFAVQPPAGSLLPPEDPKPAEKLLKYFPAEALALYSALDPLMLTAFEGDDRTIALWASLLLSIVFCALFLRKFWHVVLTSQILISCGALVLYVCALGGPFSTIPGYKPVYGVIAAVVATAFLIFVKAPTEPKP